MEGMNILIRSGDGEIIGYAYEIPFEIGCVNRLSDRFKRILDEYKSSTDTHTELADVDAGTPIPPHTEPVSEQSLIVDLCIELQNTTDFEFDEEHSETIDDARDTVDGEIVYTEADHTSEEEYYDFLAQTTYAIAEHTGEGTERMVQRELEKFLTRYSFEEAEKRTRNELNAVAEP